MTPVIANRCGIDPPCKGDGHAGANNGDDVLTALPADCAPCPGTGILGWIVERHTGMILKIQPAGRHPDVVGSVRRGAQLTPPGQIVIA